jgi:flagellar hook-length control protein FliK
VVSVPSEVSANVAFQATSARSSRPASDPSARNDTFGALVDSNAAAGNDNRSQDTSSTRPTPPRRADDRPPAAEVRSPDSDTASDRVARNDRDDRDTADNAPRDDAGAGSADTAGRTKSKSAASKSDKAKSDETKSALKSPSGDNASANDPMEEKLATTGDAVAVVIATAAAAIDVPAVTAPASGKATAPLAIAAAAIAAASSVSETASATVAATAASATATAAAAKAAGVKSDAQAAVSDDAGAQATAANATAPAAGTALAASVATAATASPKTTAATSPRPSLAAKGGVVTAGQQDSAAGTTDTSTAATPTAIVQGVPQPTAVTGKAKVEGEAVDAVKADPAGNTTLTTGANAAITTYAAAADAAQMLANSSDNGTQAAGAIQPQLPAASASQAPATQLTVTAATQAAVPLSGLAMEIAASAKSGKSRFEIRLDPADLGRIDVRIDVDRNGQVTSHLTVERPETLSMLRQDATQLQRALDNAGLQTGNSGLQFSLRDQSSSGQNGGNQSNPNAHRLIVSEEDGIPVAGRSYGRMLGASSGVDIRV